MTLPAYELTRSKRRSIAIHLRAGRVCVRAPLFVSTAQIDAFVGSRADWIAKHLPKTVVANPWRDGMVFCYLEQTWTLRWRAHAGRPRMSADALSHTLWLESTHWDSAQAKRLFLRWLSDEARARLLPALQAQAQLMGAADRLQGVVLRYTKSMWGRCNSRGEVLLNPAVLLTSERCVRYLLVHELSHLHHMNHSSAFWQRVAAFCPDWQQARLHLKQHNLSWLHQPAIG